MSEITHDQELDARGLFCPLPVLKAKRLLRELGPGQVLRVLATDPGAEADFQALCEAQNLDYLGMQRDGRVLTFHIRAPEAA